MSKIEINKLTNANVYMNGVNLLGRAEEVQLPQIKHKMAEHKALGMVGSAEFFAGIDKMECKIKWNALYPAVMFKSFLSYDDSSSCKPRNIQRYRKN